MINMLTSDRVILDVSHRMVEFVSFYAATFKTLWHILNSEAVVYPNPRPAATISAAAVLKFHQRRCKHSCVNVTHQACVKSRCRLICVSCSVNFKVARLKFIFSYFISQSFVSTSSLSLNQ